MSFDLEKAEKELGQKSELDRIRDLLGSRRFDPLVEPPELRAVYRIGNTVVSTPGNLLTITAQSKTGKTSFFGAMIASVIGPTDSNGDTLTVQSSNPNSWALVHFDYEQSKRDHWKLFEQVKRRAGIKEFPPWLISHNFTGVAPRDCVSALELMLEDAKAQFGGIHSVLLDGYADLVGDVNDAGESNLLVSQLHAWAGKYDCHVAGILHFNPNSEKARGHLGSQLERKSESNLTLTKDGDITVLYSEKQRGAPIFKANGPRFRWDDDKGMHVTCENIATAREAEQKERQRCARDDVFGERPAMRYSDLIVAIRDGLKVSEATAERRLSTWRKLGLVEKQAAGLWVKGG